MKHLLFSHFEDTLNIDKKNMTYCLMVSYRFGSIWAYIETEDLVQMNNWCHFIVDSAIYILNNLHTISHRPCSTKDFRLQESIRIISGKTAEVELYRKSFAIIIIFYYSVIHCSIIETNDNPLNSLYRCELIKNSIYSFVVL